MQAKSQAVFSKKQPIKRGVGGKKRNGSISESYNTFRTSNGALKVNLIISKENDKGTTVGKLPYAPKR